MTNTPTPPVIPTIVPTDTPIPAIVVLPPKPPTAIQLNNFAAFAYGQRVALRWETGAEFDTYGFHILRSIDGARATATQLTAVMILSTGRSDAGATYSYTDSAVAPSQRYTYWLQEVNVDGTTSEYGPVMAIEVNSLYLPRVER